MPKQSALLKFDKDVAEGLFGHQPNRPTISRRAGKHLGSMLGIGTERGTGLFHAGLGVAALFLVGALASSGRSEPRIVPQDPEPLPLDPLDEFFAVFNDHLQQHGVAPGWISFTEQWWNAVGEHRRQRILDFADERGTKLYLKA